MNKCQKCGDDMVWKYQDKPRCFTCAGIKPITTASEQQAMITAFRHAANSLGKATGVIISHVEHDEAAASVTGDHYFLELIAESELRYKRLKDAADDVVGGPLSINDAIDQLEEAMK